jgi:hypothetical protein
VGHSVLRPEAYWLAATLTCGRGAVLSHASAAALWEIRPSQATKADVTVPTQAGNKQRRGIRVHRSSTLHPDDVTAHKRIPVTTVVRTLIDLADTLPTQPLKRAVHEAEYRGLLDVAELERVVERNPGRRGKRVLDLAGGPPGTHSLRAREQVPRALPSPLPTQPNRRSPNKRLRGRLRLAGAEAHRRDRRPRGAPDPPGDGARPRARPAPPTCRLSNHSLDGAEPREDGDDGGPTKPAASGRHQLGPKGRQALALRVEAPQPAQHLVGQDQVVAAQVGRVVEDRDPALG